MDQPTERRARGRSPYYVRVLFLILTGVSLYLLWPALLRVFSAWPRLLELHPAWFAAMLVLEAASFACIWALLRLALRVRGWFLVATAQLAANAFSRIVPGGAAAGGAMQYRMLERGGVDPATVASGLTAASLISTATVAAFPVLSLPVILAGVPVAKGLVHAAWVGAVAFAVFAAVGAVLLSTNRPLELLGEAIQRVGSRVRRGRPPAIGLPQRLLTERDAIRRTLGRRWWEALLATLGNWGFDYLALVAALMAVGTKPRPWLVLLAYVAAVVLGMIPITPGGLGFVEAGLTGMLTLAGVSAPDALLATLAYRLVSFWLPLPAGLVGWSLYRRRYGPL